MPAEFAFAPLDAAPPPRVPPVGPAGSVAAGAALGEAATPSPHELLEALARAEGEAQTAREDAHAEGWAAGHAEALEAVAPASRILEEAVLRFGVETAARAERLEAEAVELALALAEKILAGALEVEPERVVESVRGALRGLVERERVTVLVNPEDLALVRDAMDAMRTTLGGIDYCEVQAERRVIRGGCVVRTPQGDVDAGVDTKLERAREVVQAALGARA